MLLSQGQSRGKVYHLPGAEPVSPEQVFAAAISSGSNAASSGSSTGSSGSNARNSSGSSENPALSDGLTADSVLLGIAGNHASRDEHGCLLSRLLDAPIVDDLSCLSASLRQDLMDRAALPRARKRLDREAMAMSILSVCDGRYVRLSVLAELFQRDADGLRKGHLDGLVKDHRIQRAFPGTPTHEMQSYRAAGEAD